MNDSFHLFKNIEASWGTQYTGIKLEKLNFKCFNKWKLAIDCYPVHTSQLYLGENGN